MQDRYAGDIGDYVKLALLRALSPGHNLGVAWYLYPDESHNSDGRHTGYLDQPEKWRALDPELFDALVTVRDARSVSALEVSGTLPDCTFSSTMLTSGHIKANERSDYRFSWFKRTMEELRNCDLVFADPDNGLIDDSEHRRRQSKFGKQIPLSEATKLALGRTAIIYHHNTRYPGGHSLEVAAWQRILGPETIAVRSNSYSCRTFFILNAGQETRNNAIKFAQRWSKHKVHFVDVLAG